ncbi:hypothetical protein M472_16555 [Sphingobacterium paucimobilis HER1398]|uniref:Uncharacterized protein n=1 Tax=Sphingobacterium paucimobilis HER1398 TaxID=1346330 RepID=U2HYL8_9SPHI|nr:hypothetical protein M472_16555 [Sphingobacterium paucimobilis HER1398]
MFFGLTLGASNYRTGRCDFAKQWRETADKEKGIGKRLTFPLPTNKEKLSM